jgi:hypothetical protein
MICDVCGEDLGAQKVYWAEEHLKKYPTHRKGFTEKKITSDQLD